MKQQLKIGFLCLVACFAIIFTSCKKEKNDPTITEFSYNKTTTNAATPSLTIDSMDVNKDGKADFLWGTFRNHADTQYIQFHGNDAAFAINDVAQFDGQRLVKIFSKDQTPSIFNEVTPNYATEEFLSIKYGTSNVFGIAGTGDVYLGFGIKANSTSDDILYGWLRVNIAADYSTVKIIDGAISTVVNKPIPCGAI